MKGFEVRLKSVRNKNHYYYVAVIAKDDTEAISYAKAEVDEACTVESVETIEKGVILKDSWVE